MIYDFNVDFLSLFKFTLLKTVRSMNSHVFVFELSIYFEGLMTDSKKVLWIVENASMDQKFLDYADFKGEIWFWYL